MLNNIKRCVYFVTAFILGYVIYEISTMFLNVGMDGASRNIFFLSLSLYLLLPIIRYGKMRNAESLDDIEYCARMNNILNNLDLNITKLQGVTLKSKDKEVTIDDLVITNKGVFNIVECKLKGFIEIEKGDKWYKNCLRTRDRIKSPIVKIRENREVLKTVLNEDEIIDIIAMVDDSVLLQGEEECGVVVLRKDELISYIEEYDGEDILSSEELYDSIYPLISDEKDLEDVKKHYNKILDNRWQFRSRFASISFFLILYIFSLINMGY